MDGIINILIVEDSAVVRDFLVYVLSSEPDFHVVGTAKNGQEAVMLAASKKPDVITMDIEMPVMNGLKATQEIMRTNAVPIVMVTSSYNPNEVEKTFAAIDAGALTILAKPNGLKHPDFEKDKKLLIDTIRSISAVKVFTRLNQPAKLSGQDIPVKPLSVFDETRVNYKLVAIGVSTGGPIVLNTIFSALPASFPLPIVVVQHIPDGFLEGMVEWLNNSCKLNIKIAVNEETIKPGNIYFCPPTHHMGISRNLEIQLVKDIPSISVKPSVSYLFRTISKNIQEKSVGIILTGMGRDGAEELALMKEKGALTIVQDKESSIVFGMPGEAVKLNAHKYILSPEGIARKLVNLGTRNLK
jgi:two-component system chemotaxis response regulator CheB